MLKITYYKSFLNLLFLLFTFMLMLVSNSVFIKADQETDAVESTIYCACAGKPCAGKDFFIEELRKHFVDGNSHMSLSVINMGDRIRSLMTEIPEWQERVAAGKLISFKPEDMLSLCPEMFASYQNNCIFITNGAPRCSRDMLMLEGVRKFNAVLWIDVSDALSLHRLSIRKQHATNKRNDDEVEVVKGRLESFKRETEPVISFIGKRPETNMYRIVSRDPNTAYEDSANRTRLAAYLVSQYLSEGYQSSGRFITICCDELAREEIENITGTKMKEYELGTHVYVTDELYALTDLNTVFE